MLSRLNVLLKLRRREVVVHINRIKPCLVGARRTTQQADEVDVQSIGEIELTNEDGEEEVVQVESRGSSPRGETEIVPSLCPQHLTFRSRPFEGQTQAYISA